MASASDIGDRVNYLLKEAEIAEADRRWRDAELLLWINDGQKEIVRMSPKATAHVATFTCVAGAKQTIGTSEYMLLRVHSLPPFDRDVLDRFSPGWEDEATETPLEYYYDPERDRQNFYVNPPADSGQTIRVTLSAVPNEVANITYAISLGDDYIAPLALYVAHRAMSKQAEYGNAGLAASFLEQFKVSMSTE